MRITIKDIAKHLGVSSATVSNVLNNKSAKVSEETRSRILSAIEELDYKPNAFARRLSGGKSNTIGLIVPDISHAHFSVLASGIEAASNKAGYSILICNSYNRIEKEQDYFDMLSNKSVDGIILAAGAIHGHYENFKISQSSAPIVMIDRYIEGLEEQFGVYLDNYHGTYLGTRYLLEQGHKRIGCITGPLESVNTKERIRGYKQAMTEHGAETREEWLYSGNHDMETGIAGIQKMLQNNPPTAIVAGGDLLAYGVYKAVAMHQLKIPDDISVIGIDDNVFSEVITPKLTSIRPPLFKMGGRAATMLHSLIEHKKLRKRKIVYMPELIVRESTRMLTP